MQEKILAQQASISIRVEKDLKNKFYSLCDDLGLSAAAALNIFMKTVVRERKIPFEIGLGSTDTAHENYKATFIDMRSELAESGVKEMTLDEINNLIKSVRDERKQ